MITVPPDDLRRQILAAGLASRDRGAEADSPTLDAVVIRWAAAAKVTGLLDVALSEGIVAASPELHTLAADAHVHAMARDVTLERALLATVEILAAGGVEPIVLKGAAVAHLDYPDPSWRSFSDVDLLIRPADWEVAVAQLLATGHRRLYPEPRPHFDRRFGKGTVMVAPGGHEVDLHLTFAKGPFGLLLDVDRLWQQAVRFELGDTELMALDAAGRSLHAAFQIALDGRFRREAVLRDFAQMLTAPGFDRPALIELSTTSRATAVLSRAIAITTAAMGSPSLDWHPAVQARDERWLRLYDDPDSSYAAMSVAALSALPRWRDRLAMATALALPQRDYVVDRHSSRLSRVRRNVSGMLRAVRR